MKARDAQQRILQFLNRFSTEEFTTVDKIAEALGLDTQFVKDNLDVLEGQRYIQLHKYIGAMLVSLTAPGRLALHEQAQEDIERTKPSQHVQGMDPFSPYESGLCNLLERLGAGHPNYHDALTLQTRLTENIRSARYYGDTEIRRAERAQIISVLDRLAIETMQISFDKLCPQGAEPKDAVPVYERRQHWGVDQHALLDETIRRAPIPAHKDFSYLHIVARPVATDDGLLDRARKDQNIQEFLHTLVAAASDTAIFPRAYSPDFDYAHRWVRRIEGWVGYLASTPEERSERQPAYTLNIQINFDGGGQLFCGRAAERRDGNLFVFEEIIAGLTTRFLSLLGQIYSRSNYQGPVDLGIAVTELEGGVSNWARTRAHFYFPPAFDQPEYRRTRHVLASLLSTDPRSVARDLVMPLISTITQEHYDPFAIK